MADSTVINTSFSGPSAPATIDFVERTREGGSGKYLAMRSQYLAGKTFPGHRRMRGVLVARDKFSKLARGETKSMTYRRQNRNQYQDKQVQVDLPALQQRARPRSHRRRTPVFRRGSTPHCAISQNNGLREGKRREKGLLRRAVSGQDSRESSEDRFPGGFQAMDVIYRRKFSRVGYRSRWGLEG